MSALSSLSGLAGLQTSSTAAAAAKNKLGKDDFLKLMIAQMRNQNPMEPQKDTEFIAQLAQFSQLEGIDKLNTTVNSLLSMQGLTQGANLIGKSVVYDKDAAGNSASGTVDSVKANNGQIQLIIGANTVNLSQIRSVAASTSASSATGPSA